MLNIHFFKKFPIIFFIALFSFNFSVQLHAEDDGVKKERSWRDFLRGGKNKKTIKGRTEDPIEDLQSNPEGIVDLVDMPTSNVIDYGGYRVNFRLYSEGGVVSHLSFGVFRHLNIGASWDNQKVIGTDNQSTNSPTLNIKLRAFDGSYILPSFTIGYEGQGRFFDKTIDQYREREKGLFLVMGRELFFPRLEFFGGINMAEFKDAKVLGSIGISYQVEQRLAVFTEYDNIRVGPENRWNAGVRIFPVPSLGIDFAFRRIASNQDKERIVRINYVGTF